MSLQLGLFADSETFAPPVKPAVATRRIVPHGTPYGPPEPVWRFPIPFQDRHYLIPQSAIEGVYPDDEDGRCSIKIRASREPIWVGISAAEVAKAMPWVFLIKGR